MDFSSALQKIKAGEQVQRQGWNGKGMFVFLVPENFIVVNEQQVTTERKLSSFIAIKDAQDNLVPWFASQADLLAEDWQAAP